MPSGKWLFGLLTARMRLLVQLSAVSRTLREAAERAGPAVLASSLLDVFRDLPPHYLSPLLARLCRQVDCVQSGPPLLAQPQAAAFLEAAGTRSVATASGRYQGQEYAQVAGASIGWPAVQQLTWSLWDRAWVPQAFPRALRVLGLHFVRCAGALDLSTLFASLCSCPKLEELQLTFLSTAAPLPACLSCPPSLQRLQLWLDDSRPGYAELGLLGTPAASRLNINLQICGDVGVLQAVPSTCQLDQLCFWGPPYEVSTSTLLALSNIHSRRCLFSTLAYQLEVLPRALHLSVCMFLGTVGWRLLASSARCFALLSVHVPLLVEGYSGGTPEHAQPWAIFLRSPDSVQGLPRHHFVQLESGWWAWRNKAAKMQGLEEPLLCDMAAAYMRMRPFAIL